MRVEGNGATVAKSKQEEKIRKGRRTPWRSPNPQPNRSQKGGPIIHSMLEPTPPGSLHHRSQAKAKYIQASKIYTSKSAIICKNAIGNIYKGQ